MYELERSVEGTEQVFPGFEINQAPDARRGTSARRNLGAGVADTADHSVSLASVREGGALICSR